MTYAERSKRAHFKRRMEERLGIYCNGFVMNQIVKQIQNGLAIHVHRETNRRNIFLVKYGGREFYVVYSAAHHIPLSCYALDHPNLRWNYPTEKINERATTEYSDR